MTKFVIYIRCKLYGIVLNYMELYDFFEIVWNSVVSNKMHFFPHKTDIFLERNASFFREIDFVFAKTFFKTVYLYAKFNNSKYMFFFKIVPIKAISNKKTILSILYFFLLQRLLYNNDITFVHFFPWNIIFFIRKLVFI